MKSKHRHDLETNELAKRISALIEQFRPYGSTALGALVAVVIVLMGWSFLSGSSAARRQEAWSQYNVAVEGGAPNLELLRQSAEEHPGTTMQELADVTWADGKLWQASQAYVQNRSAAAESLNAAESMYQSILRTSTNERLLDRARLGLARIYEMQNDLEKARAQYAAVRGDFAELAAQRAKQLEAQQTKDACQWLASAEPPPRVPPPGPGTPGNRPDFSAPDLRLPGESPQPGSSTGSLLDEFDLGGDETDDRYDSADEALFGPTSTDQPTGQSADSEQTSDSPAEGDDQHQ